MGAKSSSSGAWTAIKALVVAALTIVLLIWFLHGVDLADLWQRITEADPGLLALSLVFGLSHFFLRAWRWRYLLLPLGETRYLDRLQSTVAGYAVNNILPARGGEIARPFVLSRRSNLPFSGTLATVVLERLLDMVTVALLFAAATPLVLAGSETADGSFLVRPLLVVLILISLAAFGWAVLRWKGGTLRRAGGWMVGFLPEAVRNKVTGSAATFIEGFSSLGKGRLLAMVVFSSFVLWLSVSLATWCAVLAFQVSISYAGALFITGWLAVGMATPTPGGLGGYHAAGRYALTVFFSVEGAVAAGIALVLHALSVIPVSLWGLVVLSREGLRLTGWEEPEEPVTPPQETD